MRYLLSIIDTDEIDRLPEEQTKALLDWHGTFSREAAEAGVLRGGLALRPPATAVTVRVGPEDERLVTDGPFAEAKEHLGGYYVIEVDSRDDAIAWARRLPQLAGGSIEVRPVWEMD